MRAYALAWVDSSAKLRTAVNRFSRENPTCNDKFLSESYPTASQLPHYSQGIRRNFKASAGASIFIVAHIQCPSGRLHGVVNIRAIVYKATKSDLAMMN
nr:C2 calcium-dependent membrane targeting [Ipomoea batatas]